MKTLSNCIICDRSLSGKQRQFCSVKCKNVYYQGYETLKMRAKDKKASLIKDFGGGCNRCGYAKNIEALSFYDDKNLSLHLNTNIMGNSNLENLKQNLISHKAQLLCSNCFSELRNPVKEMAGKYLSPQQFLKKFTENLAILLPQKENLLVLAVSGGVDSVTMLTLFAENYPKEKLIVAHVNHKFRADSDVDEEFVKSLADKYGLKFVSKSLSPHKVGNLEDYFRDERHKFLNDTAKNYRADYIVLAHNADDQAETILMNLVRGSGPSGLSGMKSNENLIIRPLLTFPKSELINYAKINKLKWHEDSTNQDLKYTRNYLRHRVLPLLEKINPKYLENIGRSANIQQEIEDYIKEEARTNRLSPNKVPKPIRYEIFANLYEEARGSRKDLATKHLEELDKLISGSAGTKSLDLPGEITAIRTYNELEFVLKMKDNRPLINALDNLSVGISYFGNYHIEIAHFNREISDKKNTIYLADIADFIIRTPNIGDRIKKKGLNGHKKLQDLFVDAKIDRAKRKVYPILVAKDSNEIVWVPNLAISENINSNKIKYSITISEAIDEKNEEK